MNLDQQYSKYFGGTNLSPKASSKNAPYLQFNKDEQSTYQSNNWNRPFSNINSYGTTKKDNFVTSSKKSPQ